MNMPCSNLADCFPCFTLPTANATSELPDVITNFAIGYGSIPGNYPPLGYLFGAVGCVSLCESTKSQEDANICAARQQFACALPPGNDPTNHPDPPLCLTIPCAPAPPLPPVPPRSVFFNGVQSCAALCPDGLPFTFTVPAGTFAAASQILANEMAASYACQEARIHKTCITLLNSQFCSDSPTDLVFVASGSSLSSSSNFWELRNGNLPTGLNFSSGFYGTTLTIHGTPTVGGNFTFTLRCTAPNGDFMEKQFTVCVVALLPANSALPDATLGANYSQSITASSCAGSNIVWVLTDGALPLGLTLNQATGEISGTPDPSTVNQGFIFTIAAQIEA